MASKQKKSKAPAVAGVGVLGALIAGLIFMNGKGLGFGNGFGMFGQNSGSGSSVVEESASESSVQESSVEESTEESSEDSSEEASSAAETTVEEKTYVEVTVKGNEYLYQNNTIELTALTDELQKFGESITVRITDESASKNAYDDLTAALDEAKLAYEKAE
ncbi:MAG: hypothetical protein MJ065_06060 [Oscillospiraceae bacterium]|nr:hypothetical protein [Oscillospiraceae bacterium]